MSKSKGNVMTPLPLIEKYTADAARYWAASARLGADTAFDEKVWKIGKRLVTKLFNAGKFVLSQTAEVAPIENELDRAFVAKLKDLVTVSTTNFDAYQYAHSLQETESFFWKYFTDTYLELAKPRARAFEDGATGDEAAASGSAVAALRLGLSVQLRLLAPVLPYITEEVWSWCFAEESAAESAGEGDAAARSIHRAAWPGAADFEGIAGPAHAQSFDTAVAALAAINKAKADAAVSMGREVSLLRMAATSETLAVLEAVAGDVLAAARVGSHAFEEDAGIEAGIFEVRAIEFVEREA
jgi:valyl-tRNA synthetase